MESFDTFMELFTKWKKARNDDNLTQVLNNARSYLQNLSTSEIDLALSILLDDKTGLLNLLANVLDKSMEKSIIEGFKLLSFIIEQLHQWLYKYLNGIKNVCQSAIITKCSHYIKNAVVDCFENLLKIFPSYELALNESVQLFISKFIVCNDTERAKLFKVLSYIAKYHPEAISPAHCTRIFDRIMNDFEIRHSQTKSGSQPYDLAIYLEALNNLLVNFSPRESGENSENYYKKLYDYIKELTISSIDVNRKFVSRDAIALLGKHMFLFDRYVYQDALFWHNILLQWTTFKGENSIVASNVLSVYYQRIGIMLQREKTERGRIIFENLMQYFERKFTNENDESTSLQLSICGFGHMAGPCKVYSTEERVASMFLLIARRSTVAYANSNNMKESLKNIAYYQVTLSQILLQMSEVLPDQLNALSTLSVIFIKCFPDLPITSHSLAVSSLEKTIHNVRQANRRLCEEFIEKLVYEGIIWSCSHKLFVDAEREREMANLNERPVCYKNYLPLWQSLIYENKIMNISESSIISKKILNTMIESCIKLIKKLNLDVQNIDMSQEIEEFDIPIAVNETDFRVFINLVDLFIDIFEKLNLVLMEFKLDWFFCEIIRKSNQNPLISGFYKLVYIILKSYNLSHESGEEKLSDETRKILSQYLADAVDRLSNFSGELQVSCFNMVFEMPICIARNNLDSLVSVFKTAFSLGQSNFDLAQLALTTLEKWTKSMKREETKNFLINVVPSLEPFLQSNDSTVKFSQEISLNEKKVIKKIVLTDHEKTLQEFQRRILLFFGSLNSEVTLNFATEQIFNNETLRDNTNLLKYTLLYQDIKPDIYLDRVLLRTIELALESTDRRTRVIACEVLHSIIIIMLGKTMQFLSSNPDHLLPLFKKIFPAVLKLGSDSDQVIQQLFYPLVIQLTHWYSSKMMLRSSETIFFIDTLFDLMTFESNMALSDFCGVCLAEFVKWAIKQSTDEELKTSTTNITVIVSKITNFALHPSTEKRIGAAIAFNYLYKILRESDITIDIFWLELLFSFTKSLDGCNSAQIPKSLKHIEKVIKYKSELLNSESLQRKKPAEFKGTLLKDAADWLLVQCGSLDCNYRSKSMELLKAISTSVSGFGTIQNFFSHYLSQNGLRGLNQIILKDLFPKSQILSIEAMKPLLRTLDCYIWILNENILSFELLFTDKNANKDMIFNCIINFIYLTNVKREENEKLSGFTKQSQKLRVLQCEIILKIFNFMKILLDKMEISAIENLSSYIPTFFWNDELYSLISAAILKPDVIGFDLQNFKIMESLPLIIQQLLHTLIHELDEKHLLQLKMTIARDIENKYQDLLELGVALNSDISIGSQNYLKGLIMLETTDKYGKLYERPLSIDDSVNKVMEICDSLRKEQYGKMVAVNLEPKVKEYLENLLEFLCLKFEPIMVMTVVKILNLKTELTHQNSTIVFHGEYFMNLFRIPIFRNMLTYITSSLDTLLSDSLKNEFDTVLIILEDLLMYVKKNKKNCEQFLTKLETEFIHRFPTFRSLMNYIDKRKEKVINLYSLLVQLSKNPSEICKEPNELYSWIMQELLGYSDLEYKTRILNHFLLCIVDKIEHKKQEITRCLYKLKSDFYPVNINNLPKGSLPHSNVIASFQTLLQYLPLLKSVTLLDCVIHLTVGNVEYMWDDDSIKYLVAYFNEIPAKDSQESVQILYKYFMNTENFKSRLEILKKFLLKCIHFCDANVIEKFYEQNIKEMYEVILQDISGNGPGSENIIVSKIGCYNLFEIMFAKIPLEKINSTDSKIVKNAIEKGKTGKELFQAVNMNILGVRKLKTNTVELQELMRLLHCAAYNCSITIVSLKCEECFYTLPFAEKRSEGQLIWENIIDKNKKYDFEQEFKEIPKEYKKLINIRKQSNLKKAHNYSYMNSYNLVSSTLNEDLSRFDLYESNVSSHPLTENTDKEELMSLTFESDDLNNHECMAPICGIITHMVSRNIFNLPNIGDEVSMPKWIQCFHASLNMTTVYNVKLFMIKVILNMQRVFKPYGKFFICPLLRFLNLHFETYCPINYVIKDVLVMLIDWHSVAIPSETNEKRLAQNLLVLLIKNADSPKRYIYKYNVEIIDMVVEAWQSCLEVPKEILTVIPNVSPKFVVRIILTFLFNNKQDSLVSKREILVYLTNLLNEQDEEIVLNVCNAFGLILNFLESKNEYETKNWILNNIKTSVIDISSRDYNNYIKCIYEIHRSYPNIINYCFDQLTSIFLKIDTVSKEKCLELFLSVLPNLTEQEIMRELAYIKFQDILRNRTVGCQNVALKIIEKLMNILSPSHYLPLISLTVPYLKDGSTEQREIVTNIFIAVYKKYRDNIEDDENVINLKDLSKRFLLLDLLDPNENLQEKLLEFWTKNGNIPDTAIERMLELFNMYDVNLESSYLSILPLMMLHLISKDPQYEKKMFEPLINCKFSDYQVAVQRRTRSNVLAAPLFTSSFITQMSQYYSQSNPTFTQFNQFLNQSLFLRVTQSLQFEQTLSENQSIQASHMVLDNFSNSNADTERIPQPSKNKKSKRLLEYKAFSSDYIRQKQISKNLRRDETLKEEVDRQRNNIKIYRKYRIGDFPDTEILHSSLIEPLKALVKCDKIIARELAVTIFCSMLKEMSLDRKEQFLQKIFISFNVILDNSCGFKPLIATVLEIILKTQVIHINSSTITKVSKLCGLLSLGALLLEEKIISEHSTVNSEPSPKRLKCDTQIYGEGNNWLQLATIYKSMNDFDIVQSIFGSKKFGKDLQEASFAQAASKWNVARDAYEKAYEINEGLAKYYCQESLFVCLAHLSDWKQINHHIEKELNGDFHALWKKPMNENWMASWALQAQIHGIIQHNCSDQFLKALNDLLAMKEKFTQLKPFFGEEIAIFYINQKPEFSQSCLISRLDNIRQEWQLLNSFSYEQKINKYLKLRGLSDIKIYLKGTQDKHQLIPNVEHMLTIWNNSTPENQDDLLIWDKHITYRLYFIELLKQQPEIEESIQDSIETNDLSNMLNDVVVRQCLNVAQVAYSHYNPHFMKEYLQYSEQYLSKDNLNLKSEWQLAFAKYKYLCYADSTSQEKKVKSYISSWKESHELEKNDCLNIKLQIDIKQHISSLIIELQKLVIKSQPVSENFLKNELISKCLSSIHDQKSILERLSTYCLTKLKECYEFANTENKANCYLKVSEYCHSMSSDLKTGIDLSKEFVHSTLSAMSYGSLEASQYFPCLLNLDYSKDPELKQIFECESEKVQTWMFLKWQAQLLSHIETPISSLVTPILLRLAETYPNSFIYTFRVTKEVNKSLSTHPIANKLTEILSENKDLELFLDAVKYVVQPELYLKYHINQFIANTTSGLNVAINTLLITVYPTKVDDKELLVQGKIYKEIAEYQEKIKSAQHKEGKDLVSHLKQIVKDLDESLKYRIKDRRIQPLEDYSAWLHKFRGGNIEIPGQYAMDRKPIPQYHIKIVRLNPNVIVLPTLRKPIKITMLGNDGKNYNFLIKFGEDLRLDERIEQLFMLMNKILQGDRVCRQRQLCISTYFVIPLTSSLGFIQWIDNTRSLNEIINLILTEREKNERKKNERENILNLYINWINNPPAEESIEAIYNKALLRYGREEVTAKFNYLKNKIDWDILRKAFKKLSSSPENFFALRHNFITSYATMCIAHWILGIGDRNLSNTLISYTSGKALGIDFEYSFDTTIGLSVPELMPFRLTPQILGLLQPFDENGLLKVTMINVLRALKHGKDPLLACMDIFIREPSLDWLAKIRTSEDRQVDSDTKWYPKKKINIVMNKLDGAKPSKLTLLQIKDRFGDTEYFRKYIDIINGSEDGLQLKVRSKHKDENLSVEEQVECLLDQATDPNILARAWFGWEPWI